MNRRDFVRAGLVVSLLPVASAVAQGVVSRRRFRLAETAGLRRFGFPVEAVIEGVGPAKNFRLISKGKPVSAQFRRVDRPGLKDAVALDFNTNLGPMESEEYEVAFGGDTEPGPEPREGLALTRGGTTYKVGHRGGLTWELPTDLRGLLVSSGDGRREYLKPGSPGLSFQTADGGKRPLGEPRNGRSAFELKVDREGPYAIALRQTAQIDGVSPAGLGSNALATFVSSKSWIEVRWELDDAGDAVRRMSFELDLKLDGPPINVDFGASDYVYGQMRKDEHMELVAGAKGSDPRWTIWKGTAANRSKFAVCPPDDRRPMEGWAHVFDASRCTAVATTDFGLKGVDTIRVEGSGRLSVHRAFAPGLRRKILHVWAHVVPTPVQVGAATSPQAILGPPVVRWNSGGG